MKTSILLLALAAATPALAQVPPVPDAPKTEAPAATPQRAADAPRPVEFNFNSEFGIARTSLTFTQISDDEANQNLFFSSESGATGLPTAENIVLFSAQNRPLLTLKVSFDGDGKIQNNELIGPDDKPLPIENRDLNSLRAADSGLSVETTVDGNRLVKRVFTLNYPTWNGKLTCNYDERGRRAHDEFVSSTHEGTNSIDYAYSERGLNEIKAETNGTQMRVEIQRNELGENTQTRVFEAGAMTAISKPIFDEAGAATGARAEVYRDGALDGINEFLVQKQGDSNITTFSQFDAAGTIQGRQQQTNGRTDWTEEFENGKRRQRVEFGADGQATFVTRYKDDGNVEWKKPVGPDGQLQN